MLLIGSREYIDDLTKREFSIMLWLQYPSKILCKWLKRCVLITRKICRLSGPLWYASARVCLLRVKIENETSQGYFLRVENQSSGGKLVVKNENENFEKPRQKSLQNNRLPRGKNYFLQNSRSHRVPFKNIVSSRIFLKFF